MTELTREQLEAMADYLSRSTVSGHRQALEDYYSSAPEERAEKLSALWDKYGHFISERNKTQ